MDNLIVVGSTAYLYSYVQRNGVTPLVAFGLFTIILPYVAQKLLVAPPLSGKIRSGSVHKSKCRGAGRPLLNHGVHVIDATPARRRGTARFSQHGCALAETPDSLSG